MDCPKAKEKIKTTLQETYPGKEVTITKLWNDFGEWYTYGWVGGQEFYECGDGPAGPLNAKMIAQQIAAGLGSPLPWKEEVLGDAA